MTIFRIAVDEEVVRALLDRREPIHADVDASHTHVAPRRDQLGKSRIVRVLSFTSRFSHALQRIVQSGCVVQRLSAQPLEPHALL